MYVCMYVCMYVRVTVMVEANYSFEESWSNGCKRNEIAFGRQVDLIDDIFKTRSIKSKRS